MRRRGGEPLIGDRLQRAADGLRQIADELRVDVRCFARGALGLRGAVEKHPAMPVRRQNGDAAAFQNAEVRHVTQIGFLPVGAEGDDGVDTGIAHFGEQSLAAFLRQHPIPPGFDLDLHVT